jgi:hypothetical protein
VAVAVAAAGGACRASSSSSASSGSLEEEEATSSQAGPAPFCRDGGCICEGGSPAWMVGSWEGVRREAISIDPLDASHVLNVHPIDTARVVLPVPSRTQPLSLTYLMLLLLVRRPLLCCCLIMPRR